jgi:hypothetical protein
VSSASAATVVRLPFTAWATEPQATHTVKLKNGQ